MVEKDEENDRRGDEKEGRLLCVLEYKEFGCYEEEEILFEVNSE